jgi:catechol 2,3-dioxygenase-like lactoylglutathione lyase family enzyme
MGLSPEEVRRMSRDPEFTVVLWTTDVSALADFMADIAGLAVEQSMPGFARLLAGAAAVELHSDEVYRGHPWHTALVREGVARGIGAELRFRVDDVEATYALALRRGALAIEAPTEVDQTIECQVMGPDGFLLTLWEPAHV